MSRDVKSFEEAQDVLKTLSVAWETTTTNRNRLWVTDEAFFNASHRCIAYYDEAHNMLLIH